MRAGYKQTEVGVIPVEWRASRLGEEAELLTGFPFPSLGFTKAGLRLLRGSNVKRGVVDWSPDITQYWPEVTSKTQAYQLKLDDLVIAMDGALVGRSFASITGPDLPALLVQRVARVRSKKAAQGLLRAWIASDFFIRHVDLVKTHTAIPHISPRDIRDFALAVPSEKAEQEAIAAALGDVDALLVGLDRLIAKKCDLKQAAMQQLLTGQTRLPGFQGEWPRKRLGEIGSTYGGLTGKSKSDFGVGTALYVTFMSVMANVVIDSAEFENVQVTPSDLQNRVAKGDLLFNGSSETPEEVAMCSVMTLDVPNLYLNSFCFGFRLRDEQQSDGLFLAYLLRANPGRELMKALAQGSTRYNISKSALLEASIRLPPKAEQTAIATLLSDMDAELAALDARRTKTRDLKQAMMQELLTGRTRLVEPEAAHA